jgi:hypothetical protein
MADVVVVHGDLEIVDIGGDEDRARESEEDRFWREQEADAAADLIAGMFKMIIASNVRARCAFDAYKKVYDTTSGKFFYHYKCKPKSPLALSKVWTKPRSLGSLPLSGNPQDAWTDLDHRLAEAHLIEDVQERTQALYIAERAQNDRDKDAASKVKLTTKDQRAAARAGFPDPPVHVYAITSNKAAVIWWTPPRRTNGAAIISWVVKHYRLEATGEWQLKGEESCADLKDGGHSEELKTAYRCNRLANMHWYKFTVVAVTSNGRSVNSEWSNVVVPDKALPEGWLSHYDEGAKKWFYHNKVLHETLWHRPEEHRHFCSNRAVMDFAVEEIAVLKAKFDQYDTDHSGTVTTHEVSMIYLEIGEVVDNTRTAALLREVGHNGHDLVTFWQFMHIMSTLKRAKGKEAFGRRDFKRQVRRRLAQRRHEKERVQIGAEAGLLDVADEGADAQLDETAKGLKKLMLKVGGGAGERRAARLANSSYRRPPLTRSEPRQTVVGALAAHARARAFAFEPPPLASRLLPSGKTQGEAHGRLGEALRRDCRRQQAVLRQPGHRTVRLDAPRRVSLLPLAHPGRRPAAPVHRCGAGRDQAAVRQVRHGLRRHADPGGAPRPFDGARRAAHVRGRLRRTLPRAGRGRQRRGRLRRVLPAGKWRGWAGEGW